MGVKGEDGGGGKEGGGEGRGRGGRGTERIHWISMIQLDAETRVPWIDIVLRVLYVVHCALDSTSTVVLCKEYVRRTLRQNPGYHREIQDTGTFSKSIRGTTNKRCFGPGKIHCGSCTSSYRRVT